MREIDLGWVAGLFEGEGNIYLSNSGGINITLGMTDEYIIDRLDSLFPGKRYTREYENNWKTFFVWCRNGQDAIDFLEAVKPLLGARRQESANKAVDHWNRPDSPRQKKLNYFEAVKELTLEGLTVSAIADRLNISKTYVYRLRKELSA